MHQVMIEHRNLRRASWILVPVCLAAVSCSNTSLLGISANADQGEPGASLSRAAPLKRTVISGTHEHVLMADRASVGDLDGDGMDDFVVRAPSHVYLFYGRADFAEQLTPSDADAAFEGGARNTVALGDINCDGLADFAVGHAEGYEIVFGDRTRVSGMREAHASGSFEVLGMEPMMGVERFASVELLRPLGDIDADGCDELSLSITHDIPKSEAELRPWYNTDFVLAGRAADWPSGQWDPSWAIAEFGDEPPAYEDDGATVIVQRLAIAGSADLDGDGHSDVLAVGRERIWVFYGSDQGLHGTLTPMQANASITWDFNHEDFSDFGSSMPILLEDIDGDGTAEMGLPNQDELGIVYGSAQRWSGRVKLEPDLTIVRSMGQLFKDSVGTSWSSLEHSLFLGAPGPGPLTATVRIVSADLDGDGQRELVLQEDLNPWPASPENVVRRALYALTGPSRHATGRYVLSETDLHPLADSAEVLRSAVILDPGGDFDGDGSTDLLFGLVSHQATADSELTLHLLQGSPHDPD